MASVLRTGRPHTTSRTASSVSLPLRVRGMSSTATTRAGTWRGEAPLRMPSRIRWVSSSVSSPRSRTNSTMRVSAPKGWPITMDSSTSGTASRQR